jgi:hypothetical protein
VRFQVRSHPDAVRPFVVLDLGTPFVSLHVFEPEDLAALAAVVAESHRLLAAAVTGQDVLPVEPAAVPA